MNSNSSNLNLKVEGNRLKPIIGITTFESEIAGYHTINSYYINSVFDAGGIPVNIPIIHDEEDYDAYLNIIDGIIFTGGLDISPLTYDENPLKEVNIISSIRDKYEFGLFKKAYERKLPILGICRGHQLANIALGGSLYQDIYTQVPDILGHRPKGISSDELYHSINVEKDSKLYNIFQSEKIFVNSNHHQSIKKLGKNLAVSAVSEDGIIEAIEATDQRFFIGVQFHPECLTKKHPQFLNLFKALILEGNKKQI